MGEEMRMVVVVMTFMDWGIYLQVRVWITRLEMTTLNRGIVAFIYQLLRLQCTGSGHTGQSRSASTVIINNQYFIMI